MASLFVMLVAMLFEFESAAADASPRSAWNFNAFASKADVVAAAQSNPSLALFSSIPQQQQQQPDSSTVMSNSAILSAQASSLFEFDSIRIRLY